MGQWIDVSHSLNQFLKIRTSRRDKKQNKTTIWSKYAAYKRLTWDSKKQIGWKWKVEKTHSMPLVAKKEMGRLY